MKINQATLARIESSNIDGNSVAELFKLLATARIDRGQRLALTLSWDDSAVGADEFVPQLTFSLESTGVFKK